VPGTGYFVDAALTLGIAGAAVACAITLTSEK